MEYFLAQIFLLTIVLGREIPCLNDMSCGKYEYCGFSRCVDCFNCTFINREHLKGCPKSLEDCGRCLNGFGEILLTDRSAQYKKPCQALQTSQEETCLDCGTYKRRDSPTCAETLNDCGPCLPGYLDVITSDLRSRSCVGPQASMVSQNTEVQVNLSSIYVPTLGIVLLVGFSAFLAVITYRFRNYRSEQVDGPVLPPPYSENASNDASHDEVVEQSIICTSYKELGDLDNTARVFRLPNYVNPTTSGNTAASTATITHDEDTMPCTWTASPAEQCADSRTLSFQGTIRPAIVPETTDAPGQHQHASQPTAKRQKISD